MAQVLIERALMNESFRRISLASVAGLAIVFILLLVLGCHNHPNRSDRPLVGDVNLDGVVDESDLQALEDMLGEDEETVPPICDVDGNGLFTYQDVLCLYAKLCRRHSCGRFCRLDVPRPHLICER